MTRKQRPTSTDSARTVSTVGDITRVVEIEQTGEPCVLYGCHFTAAQVRELAAGRVPNEVRVFFALAAKDLGL